MAKSKTKRKPRGNPKLDRPVEMESVQKTHPERVAPAKPVKPIKLAGPVKPQALLFKIALALFVGWLLYLAFIAYVVMTK